MSSILDSILLSLSTNLDNLAIGVAYGLRQWVVPTSANLAIAILSGISTLAAMYLGDVISHILPSNITGVLGSLILILIGIGSIWETLTSSSSQPQMLTQDQTEFSLISHPRLGLKQAILLGLALTLTNFGTGVGAGMAQFNLILTSLFSFGSSLLTIGGGYWMGKRLTVQETGLDLGLIAGVLLMALGSLNLSGTL